jgi:hypothetical protein
MRCIDRPPFLFLFFFKLRFAVQQALDVDGDAGVHARLECSLLGCRGLWVVDCLLAAPLVQRVLRERLQVRPILQQQERKKERKKK